MNTLIFICPNFGHQVDSGIGIDEHTLALAKLFSVTLRCPMCDQTHEFKVTDSYIGASRAA
jgi:hypothetical protein